MRRRLVSAVLNPNRCMNKVQATGTISKDGNLLTTVDEWRQFASPKLDIHWKDGRSAKENARAWISAAPGLQSDVAQALENCLDIGPLRRWSAEPEARIRIDTYRGEQPNIDLLLVAEDDRGPLVVAIEAKADEPFGDTLADRRRHAEATLASNPRSKALARVDELIDRFDLDFQQSHVPQLRYQLLTATAAALEEAKRRSSKRAMLIVHEFETPLTDQGKRERNSADLDSFLRAAFDYGGPLTLGGVAGPFRIESALSLYVGKVRTVV